MKFILVVFWYLPLSGGYVQNEFPSEDACQAVGKMYADTFATYNSNNEWPTPVYYCKAVDLRPKK